MRTCDHIMMASGQTPTCLDARQICSTVNSPSDLKAQLVVLSRQSLTSAHIVPYAHIAAYIVSYLKSLYCSLTKRLFVNVGILSFNPVHAAICQCLPTISYNVHETTSADSLLHRCDHFNVCAHAYILQHSHEHCSLGHTAE